MYGSNCQWPRPPPNQVTSNFDPRISYPQAGWNYSSSPVPTEFGGGGYGFQNFQPGWNNSRGPWNMEQSMGPPIRGPPPRGGRPMRARGFGGGSRPERPQNPPSGDHYCDSCERGFATPDYLRNHQQNDHIVCGLEGCTLSAHPKIVEKHQRMQHESGLYSRLAGVSSGNPEDVQKWINQRKKNYPTKENIDRRKQEEEECLKRGESLGPFRGQGSRFGRPRGGMRHRGRGRDFSGGPRGGRGFRRGMHQRRFDGRGGRYQRHMKGRRIKKMPSDRRLASSMDDEPRGIPMFLGTAYLLGVPLDKSPSSNEEEESAGGGSFSDSEWLEEKKLEGEVAGGEVDESEAKEVVAATKSNTIVLSNALGTLIGNYASDDSDEDAPPLQTKTGGDGKGEVPSRDGPKKAEEAAEPSPAEEEKPSVCVENSVPEVSKDEDKEEESDGSAPEEVAIVRGVEEGEEKGSEGVVAEGVEKGSEGVVEEGSGREGGGEGEKKARRNRKRTRGKGNSEGAKGTEEGTSKEKPSVSDVKKPREERTYQSPQRHPTLLEELLKNEIRHERNVILQCIRYVVEKNFFDPEAMVGLEQESSTHGEEVKSVPAEDDIPPAESDISTEKCSAMNV